MAIVKAEMPLFLLSACILLPANFLQWHLYHFSKGHVIVCHLLTHNLAILNADNPICKAGYVVVWVIITTVCRNSRTCALDKPQHLGAGLAVKVAGRLVGQQ